MRRAASFASLAVLGAFVAGCCRGRWHRADLGCVLAAFALATGCAREPRLVTVNVGEVRMQLVPPKGWEHIDNGGRHEFRSGDVRMTLEDEGIATPESLVSRIRGAQSMMAAGREREAIERLSSREDPVLTARDRDEMSAFWRDWNSVAYDASRQRVHELLPALEQLASRAAALPRIDGPTYALWTVTQELDTMRFEVAGIAPATSDSAGWWVARTWSRASHTGPRRFASRIVEGRLILLDSGPSLPPEAEPVFDELLASIKPIAEGLVAQ